MSPGVWQSAEVGVEDPRVVEVGSLHPNQPGVLQVVVGLVEVDDEVVDVKVDVPLVVVVVVDAAVGIVDTLEVVVLVSSLQPNQPGVLHVDVDVVLVVVLLLVFVAVVVVLSSKQPHHPGVWQVVVRV
jgi:hypothetical protein